MGILRVAGGQVYSSGESTNRTERNGPKARAALVERRLRSTLWKAEVAGKRIED
jgi:hypothetical protein